MFSWLDCRFRQIQTGSDSQLLIVQSWGRSTTSRKPVREVGRNDLNHRFEPMRPAQAGWAWLRLSLARYVPCVPWALAVSIDRRLNLCRWSFTRVWCSTSGDELWVETWQNQWVWHVWLFQKIHWAIFNNASNLFKSLNTQIRGPK